MAKNFTDWNFPLNLVLYEFLLAMTKVLYYVIYRQRRHFISLSDFTIFPKLKGTTIKFSHSFKYLRLNEKLI